MTQKRCERCGAEMVNVFAGFYKCPNCWFWMYWQEW